MFAELVHAPTVVVVTTYNPGPSITWGLIAYAITVAALWPVFTKAGFPGWGAIIPIYNTYVLVKIAGYHGALTILFFIPVVNIVIGIIVALGIGRAFGRSGVFSFFLLWLFAIIGYFIIGYGSSKYIGEGGRPFDPSPTV
jgi:hypothetical protein